MLKMLFILFGFAAVSAFSFLLTAGLLWVVCWVLGLVGIVLVWSWKLTFVVWIILLVIKLLIH